MAGGGPTSRRRRVSLPAVVFVVLAAGFAVGQSLVLVHEVETGQTDFSVFYRTASELAAGARGELYSRRDQATHWFHCIPPVGSVIFIPLTALPIGVAAGVWATANLALLGGAVFCLFLVYARLERQRRLYAGTRLWAIGLMIALATGSLQTGQLTVLFVTCWLAYLAANSRARHALAAFALALPAAMKLYPALMWAVPVWLRARRQWLLLPLAFAALSAIVPLAAYGPRAWDLSVGYANAMLLGDAPRVRTALSPRFANSEGLDMVLLRYLTHDPQWHPTRPWFPHLRLARKPVLMAGFALRALIVLVSGTCAWRYSTRHARHSGHTALVLMALWSVTMCLLLPELKSRYALYTFPAFLPLLAWTSAAWRLGRRGRAVGLVVLIVACSAGVGQLTPTVLRLMGAGLFATLALWVAMVRYCLRAGPGST
jgi:hypothetical protein